MSVNTPPTDKECEVILQWMQTYYDGPLEPWEREFITENYYRDEFEDDEKCTLDGIIRAHLNPLPESLETQLNQLSSREA